MRRIAAILLLFITAPLLAFSLEDVMSAPFVSDLVAANGHIAWVANDRGARNVWTAAAPDFVPRQLTKYTGDDGTDLGELVISRDGEWLAFTRGGDLEFPSAEFPNPSSLATVPPQEVYTISLRDSAVHKIGDGNQPAIAPRGDRVAFIAKKQVMVAAIDGSGKPETLIAASGTRSRLTWSPDGTKIAFVAPRREHAFVGVVDLGGKSIRYLDPSVDHDVSPAWVDNNRVAFIRVGSRSQILAFAPQRSATMPWSIRIADATTGRGRELWHADAGPGSAFHGTESDQALWIAGDRVVFPWEKDGWLHLYSLPLAGGAPRPLTPGAFEVQHVALDGESIVYSSNENDIDRRHVWRVAADGSSKPVALTSGNGIELSPAIVDAKTIAVWRSDATHPGQVVILSEAKDLAQDPSPSSRLRMMVVSQLPGTFPAAELVVPQQVVFTASDGLPIHAQLFLPKGSGKHPAAVFFHGGSRRQMLLGWHYMGYYANAYAMNQFLANHGYVVLSVNYRSGIGYGLDFREALNYGTRGASEVNDVTGAALYLRTRSDVDPKRVVAWGGSYGGYLTAFALAKASDLYAAGVDLHGVHDWNAEIRVWAPEWDPSKNEALARLAWQSSPMAYVDTWRSPVLLIQGDDDRNVTFTETIHLTEQLRDRNVHVETLVFPDEIHDFLMHKSWVRAYEAGFEFLSRVIPSVARDPGEGRER